MESISALTVCYLCAAGFLASLIDSVVGGGGLIAIPALMLTGLPPGIVLGTNKLASTMCTLTSTLSFIKSGKVDFKLVRYLFPFSIIGSFFGVYVIRQIPPDILQPLVIVLLIAVAIYTLVKKDWGDESKYKGITGKGIYLSIAVALLLGFYDGFFGPGTGSFLIFVFLVMGFDFVSAAGNAKVLNFSSNIAALVTFAATGLVNFQYGLIMGLAMVAGALVGTRLAIKKGAAYVRPLFISVTVILVGKQIWDYFS
ncbi:MAG: TSUP family transporter [Clostridia bacterium]|nr:TSUP family transporter [Clostridia bacterium]